MSVHDADYKKVKKLLGIPEDEPIFVIRAQDDLALHTIVGYMNVARSIEDLKVRPSDQWFDQMSGVVNEFSAFRVDNADKIKVPD